MPENKNHELEVTNIAYLLPDHHASCTVTGPFFQDFIESDRIFGILKSASENDDILYYLIHDSWRHSCLLFLLSLAKIKNRLSAKHCFHSLKPTELHTWLQNQSLLSIGKDEFFAWLEQSFPKGDQLPEDPLHTQLDQAFLSLEPNNLHAWLKQSLSSIHDRHKFHEWLAQPFPHFEQNQFYGWLKQSFSSFDEKDLYEYPYQPSPAKNDPSTQSDQTLQSLSINGLYAWLSQFLPFFEENRPDASLNQPSFYLAALEALKAAGLTIRVDVEELSNVVLTTQSYHDSSHLVRDAFLPWDSFLNHPQTWSELIEWMQIDNHPALGQLTLATACVKISDDGALQFKLAVGFQKRDAIITIIENAIFKSCNINVQSSVEYPSVEYSQPPNNGVELIFSILPEDVPKLTHKEDNTSLLPMKFAELCLESNPSCQPNLQSYLESNPLLPLREVILLYLHWVNKKAHSGYWQKDREVSLQPSGKLLLYTPSSCDSHQTPDEPTLKTPYQLVTVLGKSSEAGLKTLHSLIDALRLRQPALNIAYGTLILHLLVPKDKNKKQPLETDIIFEMLTFLLRPSAVAHLQSQYHEGNGLPPLSPLTMASIWDRYPDIKRYTAITSDTNSSNSDKHNQQNVASP